MKGKKKYNKHRSKHTIYFFSYKNNCHIWCESFLELYYALMLEFDESVRHYASQPEFFNVYGRRYTPDFLVLYTSGYAEYIEVKHTVFIKDEFLKKHEMRKELINSLTKLKLTLISELDIDAIATENYELLKGFRQLDVSHLLPKIKTLPRKLSLVRLEKFISKIEGSTRAHAWALVAHQHFYFDVSEPFGADTILMRGSNV